MRAAVYKVRYEVRNDRLLVNLLGRSEDGKRLNVMVRDTRPYFYVPRNEAGRFASGEGYVDGVVGIEDGPPNTDGASTSRIWCRYPFDVPNVRNLASWHGEADIIYSVRTRIDYGWNYVEVPDGQTTLVPSQVKAIPPITTTPRTLFIDIETHDEGGYSSMDKASQPICSVTVYDTQTDRFGIVYVGTPVTEDEVKERLRKYFNREAPESSKYPSLPTSEIRVVCCQNEKELLGRLSAMIRTIDPDIAAGYYSEGYDFPYITKRCERYQSKEASQDLEFLVESLKDGDRRSWGLFAVTDVLVAYKKKYAQQRAHSLEAVATRHLGFGKVKRLDGITATLRNDPALLLAYNLWDVYLLKLLEDDQKLIKWVADQAFATNVELEDVIYKTRMVDGTILQTARTMGNGQPYLCVPSKQFAPRLDRKGVGGEVFKPVSGLHEGAFTVDLSTEYPAVTIELNISPEVMVPDAIPGRTNDLPTGSHYLRSPIGLIPASLQRLQKLRKEYQAEMVKHRAGSPEYEQWNGAQTSIKFAVNSYIGAFAEGHWRMNSVRMFEDVTKTARAHLEWNRNHIEDPEWLREIIGPGYVGKAVLGDTDSVVVVLYKDGKKVTGLDKVLPLAQRIKDALNATYNDFAKDMGGEGRGVFKIKLENVYSRLFIPPKHGGSEGTKKRYYGLRDWTDEHGVVLGNTFKERVKIMGLEQKRFDNAEITRTVQERIIEMVLTGREGEIHNWYSKLREEFFDGKHDEALLKACKLGRDPDLDETEGGYAVKQEHVVAMQNGAQILGLPLTVGAEWKWTFVTSVTTPSGKRTPGLVAIPFLDTLEEYEAKGYLFDIDYTRAWRKVVEMPATNVFPEIGSGHRPLGAF